MKSKSYNGQVIPINRDNVDTDLIIPKQYLKSIKKSGFGPFLFDSLRYKDTATLGSNNEREENSEFILNREPFRKGNILVSKSNFGCGSSREHAVWAIQNYGIDVVIAESFADIFSRNSYKNALLLPDQLVQIQDLPALHLKCRLSLTRLIPDQLSGF